MTTKDELADFVGRMTTTARSKWTLDEAARAAAALKSLGEFIMFAEVRQLGSTELAKYQLECLKAELASLCRAAANKESDQ
jgi:hypothetical protein